MSGRLECMVPACLQHGFVGETAHQSFYQSSKLSQALGRKPELFDCPNKAKLFKAIQHKLI